MAPIGPECLLECNYDQRFNGTSCANCLPDCTEGCTNADNCSPCEEAECLLCPSFLGTCTECVPNAQLTPPNTCECDENFLYDPVDHACERICHPYCEVCPVDITNYNCAECKTDHFMLPRSTICYDFCQNGLEEVGKTCERTEGYQACVKFDKRFLEKTITGDANIRTQGGENIDIEQADDPLPIYKRGLWMDGVDDFVNLFGLTVALEHTVEMWIRPEVEGGVIFSISKISHAAPGDEDLLVFAVRPPIEAPQEWTLIAYTIEWLSDSETTAMVVYHDGVTAFTTTLDGPVLDRPSYSHILGAEMNSFAGLGFKDSFFRGFIWSFCYSSQLKVEADFDIGPSCGQGYCTVCPGEGCFEEDTCCLIDCAWDEHVDDEGVC